MDVTSRTKRVESIWNYGILDKCHRGEEYRLFEEQLYPLNKSNTKFVKIGYSPFDDFKLKFNLWDVALNKEIMLEMHDIINMQMFLSSPAVQGASIELSTSDLFYNRTNPELLHIKEKNTHKLLSFKVETLYNLVRAKHVYQFAMRRNDLREKACNAIHILSEKMNGQKLTENELRAYYEEVSVQMANTDRIFLSEFMWKFPTTYLAMLK
jgi:hypothetical protein